MFLAMTSQSCHSERYSVKNLALTVRARSFTSTFRMTLACPKPALHDGRMIDDELARASLVVCAAAMGRVCSLDVGGTTAAALGAVFGVVGGAGGASAA